jgi:hypothetical protein
MRTAQRWERGGLPVSRPFPGHRSVVVADSELLDRWMRGIWHKRDFDLLAHIQRARELGAEGQREMHILHERMEALRGKVAAVRAVTKQLRNTKARHQAAGS